MDITPSSPPASWRVTPGSDLRWRNWDIETVVYQPFSGDTHLLNPLAAEALRHLSHVTATVREVTAHVAEVLELQVDDELHRKMEQCFERFIQMGLIEIADGAAQPASHARQRSALV